MSARVIRSGDETSAEEGNLKFHKLKTVVCVLYRIKHFIQILNYSEICPKAHIRSINKKCKTCKNTKHDKIYLDSLNKNITIANIKTNDKKKHTVDK